MVDGLKGVVLPDVCPLCTHVPVGPLEGLCRQCEGGMRELPCPRCPRCGGAIDGALACCSECLRAEARPWELAVSVFPFAGAARLAVHRFKYGGNVHLARFFAGRMAATWQREASLLPDLLVPVPLHWGKLWRRGFNQAGLLAEEVGRLLALPVGRMLRRGRSTKQQALLGLEDRQANTEGAFAVRRGTNLEGLTIVLIDDVLTTGATLGEAARVLRRSGCARVCVLTVARG